MKQDYLIPPALTRYAKIPVMLLLLFNCTWLSAQNLSAYRTSLTGSVYFTYNKCEVPPWIIPGGWRSYFFTDGNRSYVGSSPLDMINNNTIVVDATLTTAQDGCTAENMFPWRRNYYSIYSAQYFNHPTQGTVSLGFIHGENYSVFGRDQPPTDCNGATWPTTYAAFVCGSWLPNTQATNWGQQYFNNDLGAIVWPSTGYFLASNGQKSSLGCGNPTSIQADDGYMYVFYKDMSHYVVPGHPDFPYEDGRLPGLKVARAPISDALNPQAYKSFYEDASGVHWNPSLPAGFTKDLTTTYMYVQGPQATNILGAADPGTNRDYGRFSAAKVTGTNYYFGVASYQDYDDRWTNSQGQLMPKLKMALKYSYDLVHWFGNLVIDVSNDWTTSHFNYPIFLSSDGWSNNRVDPNDFYVVGTSPQTINSNVYRMHVYIPAPPPPPPPPPPPCPQAISQRQACPQPQTAQMNSANITVLDESTERAPFVYPNPGNGVYQLHYTLTDHAVTQVNVLDMTGRPVKAGASVLRNPGLVTEQVDITSQAKGIYLVELLVNGGKKTFKVIYQ